MRKPVRACLMAAAVFAGVISSPSAPFAEPVFALVCAGGATAGCFDLPFSENGTFDAQPPNTLEEAARYPTAVSIVALPDGRFVYWDGLADIQQSPAATVNLADYLKQQDRSRILDLGPYQASEPIITAPAVNETGGPPGTDNLFCADQRLLSDGRVIAAGGTRYLNQQSYEGTPLEGNHPLGWTGMGTELYGSKHTRAFAADAGGAWSRVGNMRWNRWYPSMLTLPSGKLLIAGGVSKLVYNSTYMEESPNDPDYTASSDVPRNVVQSEVFDPVSNTWSDNPNSANKSLPLFARLHMIPSGDIAFSANGQQFNPMGEDVEELSWNNQAAYDHDTRTWRDLGVGLLGARSGAAEVMMRLEPDGAGRYSSAKVLMAGGTLGVSPGTEVAVPFTEVISYGDTDGDGAWDASTALGPNLNNPRWFSTAVNLPNGEVAVFNGSNADDVIFPGYSTAVHQAELFNGTEWVPLASGKRDRVYHNSAILLRDGSILVGGHSPINNGYGGAQPNQDEQSMGLLNNNLRDPSFERYYPPYLYKGERPVISAVQSGPFDNGDEVVFTLNGSDPEATEVVLSRLPAQTHVTDADARTIKVGFSKTGTSYRFDVPGGTVVPPGYYYLFAMSAQGVPSIAKIINIR